MNQVRFSFLILVTAIVWTSSAKAADTAPIEKLRFAPIEAKYATWVFSGTVATENGENYGYFFQMQRDNNHFHATAALLDENSKDVLFSEDSTADIDDLAMPYNWRVGRAFLRFSAVNDSWIFGVKPKDQLGFNFKVDMLKQFASAPGLHHLRSGVTMMVSQTSELNGHILTGTSDKELFVRANDAWFRQVWQDEQDTKPHALSCILCRFNDGSSFYSVNLQEPDAQSGAVAGWYNPKGIRQSMSQFIRVAHSDEGVWRIQAQSPHIDLALKDPAKVNSVIAGFIEGTNNPGFCMLNQSS